MVEPGVGSVGRGVSPEMPRAGEMGADRVDEVGASGVSGVEGDADLPLCRPRLLLRAFTSPSALGDMMAFPGEVWV